MRASSRSALRLLALGLLIGCWLLMWLVQVSRMSHFVPGSPVSDAAAVVELDSAGAAAVALDSAGAAAVVPNSAGAAAAALDSTGCPGRFVTINYGGRLGNNICQYLTLWSLQLDDARARPAWIQRAMSDTLSPLFGGLSLPVLPQSCNLRRLQQLTKVPFTRFDEKVGPEAASGGLLLDDNPCAVLRFHPHRAALRAQLGWRRELRDEAQSRLHLLTAARCTEGCTYVGVHVRRTDYGRLLRRLYNGTMVGELYLTRALALCRLRYTRPVFLVSSDDLAWTRRALHGAEDVVMAGSVGADAAARDMALLAQCNHTVVTHGTYGYMSAYLAGGDIVAPRGFGARESNLLLDFTAAGLNVIPVNAF